MGKMMVEFIIVTFKNEVFVPSSCQLHVKDETVVAKRLKTQQITENMML